MIIGRLKQPCSTILQTRLLSGNELNAPTFMQPVQARIQQQNRLFRQTYPNGSPITGSTQ
jgi:hypothetical protein